MLCVRGESGVRRRVVSDSVRRISPRLADSSSRRRSSESFVAPGGLSRAGFNTDHRSQQGDVEYLDTTHLSINKAHNARQHGRRAASAAERSGDSRSGRHSCARSSPAADRRQPAPADGSAVASAGDSDAPPVIFVSRGKSRVADDCNLSPLGLQTQSLNAVKMGDFARNRNCS